MFGIKEISVDASPKWRIYAICDERKQKIIHFGLLPDYINTPTQAEEFAIRKALRLFMNKHGKFIIENDNKPLVERLNKKIKWKHISIAFKNPNFADILLKEIVREDIYKIRKRKTNLYATIRNIRPKFEMSIRM